jgi:hypothetical protein
MIQPVEAQSSVYWESICNDATEVYTLGFCDLSAPELLFSGYGLIAGEDSYVAKNCNIICDNDEFGPIPPRVYGKVSAKILLGTELYHGEFELVITNLIDSSILYVHGCRLIAQAVDWSVAFSKRVGVVVFVATSLERICVTNREKGDVFQRRRACCVAAST